jgi:ADP-heptose:LPS heptosyltransferase
VYVVEPAAWPVVQHNPHLSDVIVVPHLRGWRRVAADLALARRLRRERFDIAIDLHGGPRSAWLTWASRAPRRVGYGVAGRSWMYTTAVHRSRVLQPRHSVENQWDLLPAVDAAFPPHPDRRDDRVEMAVDAAARQAVDRRLREAGVRPDQPIVVLHVSAGNPFRRWPEPSFAALAAGIAGRGADRIVLITSGPSDHDAARRVVAQARTLAAGASTRLLHAEGLSLGELRALMDRAALFIGGDSGPLHIAATSDVPVVGLYGPTLAARSAPWRPDAVPTISIDGGVLPCRPCDQRVCVTGDYRCLTRLTADSVSAAAEQLLRRAS